MASIKLFTSLLDIFQQYLKINYLIKIKGSSLNFVWKKIHQIAIEPDK